MLECRKIAAMAEAYDVAVAPHCPLGPLALAACLQLAACTPNVAIQEMSLGIHYNVGHDLLFFVTDPEVLTPVDGYLPIPQKPGLGVTIDEAAVREAHKDRHRWRNPIWRQKRRQFRRMVEGPVRDDGLVTLAAGPLELVLSPAIGGSIARFDYSRRRRPHYPILRGCEGRRRRRARERAAFRWCPTSTAFAAASSRFRGRTVRSGAEHGGRPEPASRPGLARPVAGGGSDAAPRQRCEFEHAAGEWPWAYVAEQRFKLDRGRARGRR